MTLTRWSACWWAVWARGGNGLSSPGRIQFAQSPIANTFSSPFARSVSSHDQAVDAIGFETVEIFQEIRRLDPGGPDDEFGRDKHLVAKPDPVRRHFGDLEPAAYLDPEVDEADVPMSRATCSGKAGRMRGPASMMVIRISLSKSMLSRLCDAISRIDLCSSAASSTPVAPAPTMTQWSWPGDSCSYCALARRQASIMRRLKRAAWLGGIERYCVLAAPGVPKSLQTLPTAITSVS